MAYTEQDLMGCVVPAGTGVLGLESIDAAAAVHGEFIVAKRCKIKRIMFVVTVLVAADTTAPVVEFNRRPTIGSATGEVLLGQLTIPDGTAVGTVIYKDIDPVTLEVGDSLALEHVTQAADAGIAAGDGYYAFELEPDPEYVANESNMVASA